MVRMEQSFQVSLLLPCASRTLTACIYTSGNESNDIVYLLSTSANAAEEVPSRAPWLREHEAHHQQWAQSCSEVDMDLCDVKSAVVEDP